VLVEVGVNPAAPSGSIMLDCPSDRGEGEPGDPSMFGDLNLDQVFAAVPAGRDEYDLTPFFRAPPWDVRAVEYRHEPLPASYGQDLYQSAFGTADQTARA
jgi:DNA mismatch repair protein MutS